MTKRWLFHGCLAMTLVAFTFSQTLAEVIWQSGPIKVEDEMAEDRGRITVGKLKVIPTMKVGGVYDDNIFLGNDYTNNPNNPGTTVNGQLTKPLKSDYILHLMPGLLANYAIPGGRGNVNLGYEGDWAFYESMTVQNWNNQRGIFNADYKAPAGLLLGIDNVFTSAEDPYGDATQYALGYSKKRWNNDLNTKVGWDFHNRLRVLGYYDFYKQKYDDDRDYTQNWTTNGFGIGVEMRVLPRTWAFLRYHLYDQNFDTNLFGTTDSNNADNKQNSISSGLLWDGGGKLEGEVNFGWGWLDYDNSVDRNGRAYENYNTWVAATSLSYRVLARTRLTFNIARAIRPTGADKQEYYDDTQVGLNIAQDLPYKLSLNAGFIYSRNDYNTAVSAVSLSTDKREDDNYLAAVNLKYKIRPWLDASLGYRYLKKDSNDVLQSFTDNQVILAVGASY